MSDSNSAESEKLNSFDGEKTYNLSSDDQAELKRLVTNNPGVERIISELYEGAGELGPLENPYDINKVESHPAAKTNYHEQDEWKYPIYENA
ncbi:unnamed protein product [Candida verbasci]|uniref:Uncharacterized protein n=1 Tax=Candida verbasci TaxID=1227364 RepID=A0A9W4TV80_9ASCO|nr:unnamed protein product [Candida verbasci]